MNGCFQTVREERLKPMRQTYSLKQKVHQMLIILGPIVVTQIALQLMSFADTVMSGRFAPTDLAGVAIGSSIWLPVNTGLGGILLSLTPIVAQLLGAGRKEDIGRAVLQGIYLAVALSLTVLSIGRFVLPYILRTMQLEADVYRIAYEYLGGIAWGIVPLFVYSVMRSFMDALGQTRVTMIITLLSFPINVLFNYGLIFGRLGLPRLGGVGSGYATAITCWIIALIATVVIVRYSPFTEYRVFGHWRRPDLSAWAEQLRIGVPIGFAVFFEVGIFSAVSLLVSRFGTETIAANQAALNFAGLLYMVPMSIAMTLTIVVGFEVGARRIRDAMQYSGLGMGASLTMALLSATALVLFRSTVAAMYTSDGDVARLIESFLFYVIFFQLSDAVAAPIQGILRGFKDVNVTMVVAIISYWVIGLPLGYVLATYTNLEAYGYWIGLISGLAAGAVGLALRLRHVRRQHEHETVHAEAVQAS